MDKPDRQLIAGPFVGEFGWEIMCWQAYVRALSRDYDHTTVRCRPKHEYLYEDFADKIEHFTPDPGYIDCCWHSKYVACHETPEHRVLPIHNFQYPQGYTAMPPQLLSYGKETAPTKLVYGIPDDLGEVAPEFIKYGRKGERAAYDVILHGRSRYTFAKDRNWPTNNWDELSAKLIAQGLDVVTIGTKQESFIPEGSTDYRDETLEAVCNVMATASIGVGPSSGPMHLMSMCGLPHITWSHVPTDKHRYEIDWNPLNTPAKYMEGYSIDIPVEVVYREVMEGLDGNL